MLAATVYNPPIRVRYQYRRLGPYGLDEDREALRAAIAADGDILTQFREAEELLVPLARASSFSEVADVMRRARADPDAG